MEPLFLRVLTQSLTASYVILLVIAVRWLLLRRAPKIFSYALWLVVLLRLICPLSLESTFSLVPSLPQFFSVTASSDGSLGADAGGAPRGRLSGTGEQAGSEALNGGDQSLQNPPNEFDQQDSDPLQNTQEPQAVTRPWQLWLLWGSRLWLAGVMILWLHSLYTAIQLSIRLRAARPVSGRVYELAGIETPFVFGMLRPKIYFPPNLEETEKAYLLLHEETHLRRLDHLIKPIGYLTVCLHWFNPLAWVAYHLLCHDMEMACDERVIGKLGAEIKKEYSNSLLSLSTGRLKGCPLAFGENPTKGRIKNVLRYKKPALWVGLVTLLGVAVLSAGLLMNPKQAAKTVEDYAWQFLNDRRAIYDNVPAGNMAIADSKITLLEQMVSFDGLLDESVELWRLEYRLKPENLEGFVMAGGMDVEDGWITEDSSMGKPILVFTYRNNRLQYLGNTWSGENDYTTPAGQETGLRRFLEAEGLLPHETYPGNHILVKFLLSSGETAQLFLSQPVAQGEGGIWCIERWKDTNGNEYLITPEGSGTAREQYAFLQQQVDSGQQPELLNPVQVALAYLNEDLGHWWLQADDLTVIENATLEDFAVTPASHFIGWISNFRTEEMYFHLDPVEWLTTEDHSERMLELGINPQELPNGFYIYNPQTYPMWCRLTEETRYNIINWAGGLEHQEVTMAEFVEYMNQYPEGEMLVWVIIQDGVVLEITEQYRP